MKRKLVRIIVAAILFGVIFTIDKIVNLSVLFPGITGILVSLCLYLTVYLLVGYDVIWKAVRNIFHGQFCDENLLMVVATFGAFGLAIYRGIIGQSPDGFDEACAVLLFYQVGEWLQKYATGKSRNSIEHLMNLKPDYANLLVNNKVTRVDPSDVKVGSIIVINPGEKIPLDGIIVSGQSDLDTKSLTGESMPRAVKINDEVLSGCINLTAQIKVRVTKEFYDSTASKILDLVENAAMKKSKAENFITKFARYYTPIVMVASLCLAVITSLITSNWETAIYRALSFLVVSCPCALVISVPLSFFVALGVASKNGILVKGSNYLEKLNHAQIFVFDKTGTLTKGNFVIAAIEPKNRRDEILALAAVAENGSIHPIANAIRLAYGKNVESSFVVKNVAGEGVIAIKNDETIYCGSAQLLIKNKIKFQPKSATGTIVYVAHNQTYLGYIIIRDEIKPESATVLGELANKSLQTVMLTGDNENVAADLARSLNLKSYRANLLPQDKMMVIEEFLNGKKPNQTLCFIGDGINDAPSLVRADVGISMGGIGSDAALEAADVILMHDDLTGVLTARKIARRTMRIVRQNIILSLMVKIGILALSAIGFANMWLAIFGDVGVSLLAILNAFRINTKFNQVQKKRTK